MDVFNDQWKDLNKIDKKYLNRVFAFVLGLICISLYANTYHNGYCLDDVMVIAENTFTQKGFSGIADHFSNDYLFGYLHTPSESALSPWRPLTLITFSIEVGLFGKNHPEIGHLINTALYAITTVLLFTFLAKHLFKNSWLAFFSALLFAIHPIHTEVVANIKSRDEIMSLLFIIGSIHLLFDYAESFKKHQFILSLFLFFLALLSKESAITFLIGIPVFLYFFSNANAKKIKRYTFFYFLVALVYLFIRFSVLSFNLTPSDTTGSLIIVNYPFLYAQGFEAFFTKVFILLKYLSLLFFPYPLRYDYSYNQIPYVNGSNPMVWLSMIIYIGLAYVSVKLFKRRSILSFCIVLFFITMSLISNFFIELAVTIGERLLFAPSVFFCIALVFIGNQFFQKVQDRWGINKKLTTAVVILPIFIFSWMVVVSRNKDWKNMDTLNIADFPKTKNSIRVNDGVANYYLLQSEKNNLSVKEKDSLLERAIQCYSKSLELFPEFDKALLNIGVCYDRLGNVSTAEAYWARLKNINPNHPKLIEYEKYLSSYYLYKGIETNKQQLYDSSLIYFNKAISHITEKDSTAAKIWYHAAGMYYSTGKFEEAKNALGKVLEIEPNNQTAIMGYRSCEAILKKP